MDIIKTKDKIFSVVYHTRLRSENYNMKEMREDVQQASYVGSLETTFKYINTNLEPIFNKTNFIHNKGTYLLTESEIHDKITEQFNLNAVQPVRMYIVVDNTTMVTLTVEPRIYAVEDNPEVEDKPEDKDGEKKAEKRAERVEEKEEKHTTKTAKTTAKKTSKKKKTAEEK